MVDKCTCEEMLDDDLHPCPYALDVGNEFDLPEEEWSLCNCCPYCEDQCAMDV